MTHAARSAMTIQVGFFVVFPSAEEGLCVKRAWLHGNQKVGNMRTIAVVQPKSVRAEEGLCVGRWQFCLLELKYKWGIVGVLARLVDL